MKAILEFNLSEYDDDIDFQRANKASNMCNAIWIYLYQSKKQLMYELENEEANKYDAVEKCFEKFTEILNKNDVNIDQLW